MNSGVVPPDEPVRQRRARPWRGLIATGGLLLAGTFFMPAVPGCQETIVPAVEAKDFFTTPSSHDWADFAQLFLLFLAAYLWGLLIGLAALLRLLGVSRGSRECNGGALAVLSLTAALLTIHTVAELLDDGSQTGFMNLGVPLLVGFVVGPVAVAYQLRAAISLGRRAYLAVGFVGALAASAWFACWILGGYYGVRLSFVASLVILAGIIGESAVLTRRRWLGTIWRLVTCRLRDAEIPAAACPKCQYDLRGAAEMRCPECGRPFSFDELGLWPEELGFGRRLGAEGCSFQPHQHRCCQRVPSRNESPDCSR